MNWKGVKSALDTAATIAVLMVGTLLGWRLWAGPSAASARVSPVQDVSNLSLSADRYRTVLGTGEIAMVEFSDFDCPFCARYATTVFPQVKEQFIDSGIIRYVPLHFPLQIHPLAPKAAEAAECAGRQNRFWEMHGVLFVRPAALEEEDLKRHALSIGLGEKQFVECLSGSAATDVESDLAEGRRLGVTGTPSFFLGKVGRDGSIELHKRIEGVGSIELFREQIALLQDAE